MLMRRYKHVGEGFLMKPHREIPRFKRGIFLSCIRIDLRRI